MSPSESVLSSLLASHVPTKDARSIISSRRQELEQHLSEKGHSPLFETGSWSHGTALIPWSDVDYFVWMDGTRPKDPQDALWEIRDIAYEAFDADPYFVSFDPPAVSIEAFDGTPKIEVVPAYWTVGDSGDFYIPDPAGSGWIRSHPKAHKAYVNRAQETDRQAKSLVRLLKLWGYRNDVPIRSLYLEMRAAKRVLDSPPVIFYWDLHAIFTDILALPAMNDPSKYDGRRIEPCASTLDLTRARQATVDAAAWAQLGADAERDEDFTSAEYYWSALFAAL